MEINLKTFTIQDLEPYLALVLINPTKTPVHVGLILDNYFLESTIRGAVEREKEVFYKWAINNSDGACIVDITLPAGKELDVKQIKKEFLENALINPGTTCLDPIVKVLGLCCNENLEGVGTIFELIARMREKRLIKDFYWIGKNFKSTLYIEPYNRQFVLDSINRKLYA